jgi:hypothetical protein
MATNGSRIDLVRKSNCRMFCGVMVAMLRHLTMKYACEHQFDRKRNRSSSNVLPPRQVAEFAACEREGHTNIRWHPAGCVQANELE